MKPVKKLLSMFLSVMMVISLISIPAKAEETQTNIPYDFTNIVKSYLKGINDVDYQRAVQQKMAEKLGLDFNGEIGENNIDSIPKLDPSDEIRVIVELNGQSTYEMAKSQKVGFSNALKFEASIDAVQKPIIEKAKGYGQIRHTYKNLFNGFSATVKLEDIEMIKKISGVKSVRVANLYKIDINTATQITKANTVWQDYGFKGEGTVVAIVDTGIDYTHKDMKLTDTSKVKLTQPEVETMIGNDPNHQGKWFSEKVPFGYNFADLNNTVIDRTSSMHGMHVAGIVGANGDANGTIGVAPEAQLLAMKVFSNNPDFGSAYNDDIAAAIESSAVHGADVINMSLGSTAGFVNAEDAEQKAIKNATDAGVVVVVSAGNSYYSTESYGIAYPQDPDISVVGAPGLFGDTIQVASSENTNIKTYALNYKDGLAAYYTAGASNPVNVFTGQVEYVDCKLGLIGTSNGQPVNDFDGTGVLGKIALVQRGGYPDIAGNFTDKIMNAQNKGATGVIVYNSAAGGDELMNMAYPDATGMIPAVFIGLNDGLKLKSLIAPENKVEFNGEQTVIASPTAGEMSDFSSWGTAPGLEFKPEVTAPGGNIYSTVNNNSYEVMGGTSMSSPHTAGAVALVLQSLKNDGVSYTGRELVTLAKKLIINSSEPIIEPYTALPYLTRKQGAGLIQIDKAVKTNAYVTDGNNNATIALKEIGGATNFQLKINNFGIEELTFIPEDKYGVLTNALIDDYYIVAESRTLQGASVAFDKNEIVVPAKSEAVVNVTLTIPESAAINNFAEGFITLTEKTGKNPSLGVPYMGFYGSWSGQNGPRMFDAPLWDVENVFFNGSTLISPEGGGNYLGYVGPGKYGYPGIDPNRIAFSPNYDGHFDSVTPYFNLMRNAKELMVQVLDSEGKVVREISYDEYLRKSYISPAGNNSNPILSSNWDWDGTVYNPITGQYETAAEGKYTIRLMAKPDIANAEWYTLDMPVMLDTTEPTFTVVAEKIAGNDYKIELIDSTDGSGVGVERYLVFAKGVNLAKEEIFELEFDENGEDTITLSDCDYFPLTVIGIDYAGNANNIHLVIFNDGITIEPLTKYYNNKKGITIKYSINQTANSSLDHVAIALDGGTEINNGKNQSYGLTALADGKHTVTVRLYSTDGKNIAEESVEFVVDTAGPVINTINPVDPSVILTNGEKEYTIKLNVTDNILLDSVKVNGVDATKVSNGNYQYTVALIEGLTNVTIEAVDMAGNISSKIIEFNNNIDVPIINITSPAAGDIINSKQVKVEGSVIYKSGVGISTVDVNGQPVTLDAANNFSTFVDFSQYGDNEVIVKATAPTSASNTTPVQSTKKVNVMLSPLNFAQKLYTTTESAITIDYSLVTTDSSISISLDGDDYIPQPSDSTSFLATDLSEGEHTADFNVFDSSGGILAKDRVDIRVDNTYPTVTILDEQGTNISEGNVYNSKAINIMGVVSEELKYLRIDGKPITLGKNGQFASSITLRDGISTVRIEMKDMAGNENDYMFKTWLDMDVPEVTIIQPATDIITVNEAVYTIKLNARDNTFGYKVYINGDQIASDEENMGLGTEVKYISYDYTVPKGTSTLNIKVVDVAGNVFEKDFTISNGVNPVFTAAVVDTTAKDFDKKAPQDKEIKVAFNDDQLTNIYYIGGLDEGSLVKNVDYIVQSDKIVIKSNFMSMLPVEQTILVFEFKSGLRIDVLLNVSDSSIKDVILLNGQPLEGFNIDKYDYIVGISPFITSMPVVSYKVVDNPGISVKITQTAPDIVTIKVIEHNGTKIYTVRFVVPLIIEKISAQAEYAKGSEAEIKFRATNVIDKTEYATIIVGLYDENGKLVKLITEDYTVQAGESVDMSATMTTPNADGYTIKCFIWNSMDGMKPLYTTTAFPVK